jgi:CheY-like chemotaxis protein
MVLARIFSPKELKKRIDSGQRQGRVGMLRIAAGNTVYDASKQNKGMGIMSSRKVLLVEDEALVAMAAIETLNELGFEVLEAPTARAALDHFGADGAQFEFAVVDFGLPDRPGEQLIAELKALRPDLPIIVASGYNEDELRRRIKLDDRFAFLNKPYDLASLQRAIDALARD